MSMQKSTFKRHFSSKVISKYFETSIIIFPQHHFKVTRHCFQYFFYCFCAVVRELLLLGTYFSYKIYFPLFFMLPEKLLLSSRPSLKNNFTQSTCCRTLLGVIIRLPLQRLNKNNLNWCKHFVFID